jgi:hypothetical protein
VLRHGTSMQHGCHRLANQQLHVSTIMSNYATLQSCLCVILANILEQCSLFLPLRWGAGSMALMLWLNW